MDMDPPTAIDEAAQVVSSLPRLRFDTASYAERHRLSVLNAFSHGLYCYQPQDDSGSSPRLKLDAWALGDVAAAAIDYGPTAVGTPDHVDADFEDMVFVRRVNTGRIRVESGDVRREFGPGSVFLMHAQHKLRTLDDGTALSLRLPFQRAGYDPLREGPIVSLRKDAWQVRVLISALDALFETLPSLSATEAPAVSKQLASLVQASIEAGRDETPHNAAASSARTLAMRRYVIANLARKELGVGHLQIAFNASRATVYRAFEDVGGVARFIREHRLAAIHRELRMTSPTHGMIRRIAECHGLSDQTNFLRIFRAQYGLRPSDVLGSALEEHTQPNRLIGVGTSDAPKLASFWTGRR